MDGGPLLFTALEDWFALRGRWYLGPKQALATLRSEEPAAYALAERALMPEAKLDDIAAWVDAVVGAR